MIDRDVEGIAEAHKARAFHRGIDVQAAGEKSRLIGDNAHGAAIETREADNDIFRQVLVDFEEIAVIHHAMNHVFDIVGQIRFRRNNGIELMIGAIDRIGAGTPRRVVSIVLREEAQQLADHLEALGIVASDEMRRRR